MWQLQPKAIVRDEQFSDKFYSIPSYLRTSWTSHESEDFERIVAALPADFSSDEAVFGFKQSFKKIGSEPMNILATVAVLDNGHSPGLVAKLATQCYQNGIPLVLGKGARILGERFRKNRICCVCILRRAAGKEGMHTFISNLSSIASETKVCPEEGSEILEKFREAVEEKPKPAEAVRAQMPAPKKQKPNPPPQNGKKQNKPAKAFFASFD